MRWELSSSPNDKETRKTERLGSAPKGRQAPTQLPSGGTAAPDPSAILPFSVVPGSLNPRRRVGERNEPGPERMSSPSLEVCKVELGDRNSKGRMHFLGIRQGGESWRPRRANHGSGPHFTGPKNRVMA